MRGFPFRSGFLGVALALAAAASAAPIREWDWRMPGSVYKELDFTDRAAVDRAVKIFDQAVGAENRGVKVTDLVPRYRAAAGEWRKVQVQAETEGGNEALLAYAVFMQGYSRQQAHDRNEAMKLFNEVLDLYPEQTFVAVPARYLLSVVKREIGDIKQADQDIEAIVEDRAADGHPLYYSVVRTLAANRWAQDRVDDAAELWSKIVFTKGRVNDDIWRSARGNLIVVRLLALDFEGFEQVLFERVGPAKAKRADAVAENASWMSGCNGNHPIAAYLDRKYPPEKKAKARKKEWTKLMNAYADWLNRQVDLFAGQDDGWRWEMLQLGFYAQFETKEQQDKRISRLVALTKNAKPDVFNSRVRTLISLMLRRGNGEYARTLAAMPKEVFTRLRMQIEVESALCQWKAVEMYLLEFLGTKPPPSDGTIMGLKYELAGLYLNRLGAPDKAVKIYQEIDDPPRSLWCLADALRQAGKKNEAYTTLTEIASIFPNDAPSAVLRAAQWRESDGAKEKAIALYRRLLSNPKWKQTGASSQAHQALERLGIATGGAMTTEVR